MVDRPHATHQEVGYHCTLPSSHTPRQSAGTSLGMCLAYQAPGTDVRSPFLLALEPSAIALDPVQTESLT